MLHRCILTFLMSKEWMPVLNSSMSTVLPIFLLTFYVLSYHLLVSATESSINKSSYSKTTERPTYLMYCSFYPHNIKSSIVFNQLLRLKRTCSDISDYDHQVKILTRSLLSRGYPSKLFYEKINRASHITQT